jgi:hypothetical protein
MTSLRKLVLLIPKKYRKQLLDQNVIYRAKPNAQDPAMQVLHTVWTTFIDREGDYAIECAYCCQNIIKNFQGLQSELVALAQEENLLDKL